MIDRMVTILKPDEMAKELGITRNSLLRVARNDFYFPYFHIGATYRFIKEFVLPYWSRKKKEDHIVYPLKLVGVMLDTRGYTASIWEQKLSGENYDN